MFKKLCMSITPLLLLAAVPAMADEPVMSKFKLSIGGFVKLDYAHESNGAGPLSPGAPGGGVAPVAGNVASKDNSIFTAKQSRFWLKVAGPEVYGAKTNALIEMDFYGAGSLANEFANMRMRHAYGSLDWNTTQVLFGQFWDIFGATAADTIDFRLGGGQGVPANPRVPQVRLTQKLNLGSDNALKFVLGVQNPVQDAAIAGNNSMAKTNTSFGSVVNVAGQVSFTSKVLGVSPGYMGLGNNPLTLTLFGLAGNEKMANGINVNPYGYGAYAFFPIIKSSDGKSRAMTLSLETQAYVAAGLDVQGATALSVTGSGGTLSGTGAVTANATSLSAAKGYGLYGQLKFFPTQNVGLTAGYTRRETLNWDKARNSSPAALALSANALDSAFAARPERSNQMFYGNITYDLNAAVRVAAEFERIETLYTGSTIGQNNTVRAAAFYFF